jgi:hypothetical protein
MKKLLVHRTGLSAFRPFPPGSGRKKKSQRGRIAHRIARPLTLPNPLWSFSSRATTIEAGPSPTLNGIWLLPPCPHHGFVPAWRDLLNPVARRPKTFCRGHDVHDSIGDSTGMGFVSRGFDT